MSELPAAFLRLSVTDLAHWFSWCVEQNLTTITEVDYKEQFNNINPDDVHEEMKQATDWPV